MAAMKFSAVRNPNERWLIDLILLFIPSTAPLESSGLGPGEDPVQMSSQHPHEFLEWLQLRPHGRAHPLVQVLLGAPRLLVGPEQLEGFLQVPGAHQRRVPADQRGEPLLLVVC